MPPSSMPAFVLSFFSSSLAKVVENELLESHVSTNLWRLVEQQ